MESLTTSASYNVFTSLHRRQGLDGRGLVKTFNLRLSTHAPKSYSLYIDKFWVIVLLSIFSKMILWRWMNDALTCAQQYVIQSLLLYSLRRMIVVDFLRIYDPSSLWFLDSLSGSGMSSISWHKPKIQSKGFWLLTSFCEILVTVYQKAGLFCGSQDIQKLTISSFCSSVQCTSQYSAIY